MSDLPHNGYADAQRSAWLLWGIAGSVLFILCLNISSLWAGEMPDADDLLRLQQVRDLINGQSWYDVDQSRFLTPEGGALHWSRIPDIFLAGFITMGTPFLGQEHAEYVAALIWPLGLLAATFAVFIMSLRRLGIGVLGQALGLVFLATSSVIYNFWPGRIDHHNVVSLAVLTGFCALISPRMTARAGLIAAIAICLALSVAVESLPYAATLIGLFGLFWVVRGHQEASRITALGMGLILASTAFMVFDAPGLGPKRHVCDALSYAHWTGLLVGGSGLVLLGVFASAAQNLTTRLALGTLVGTLSLACLAWVNPACLGDPYADVSELVRSGWLSVVGEARTLSDLWSDDPARAILQFGFTVAGLLATLLMLVFAPAEQRLNRIGLATLMLLATLATIWQIRGVTFSHLFGAIAAAWLVSAGFAYWRQNGGVPALLVFCASVLLMSPTTWAFMAAPYEKVEAVDASGEPVNVACVKAKPLTHLPTDNVLNIFTPIDLGVPVLARSKHNIFAAPYHRNIGGLEQVLEIWTGPADRAQSRLERIGADHVLFCPGMNETGRYMRMAPNSLAADLTQGRVPDWLEPVPLDGVHDTDLRLYRIKP